MALSFSQRIGLKPIKTVLQIDDMDMDLRNSLWNYCETSLLTSYMLGLIFTDFFKKKQIEINFRTKKAVIDSYYKYVSETAWYNVYDFLEFIIHKTSYTENERHIRELNEILERELSGYRFIDEVITPITDRGEISEIIEASENPKAETHIKTAISLLSDRKNPDYRNSIKESISAVEAICRELTGKSTLGSALDFMKSKEIIDINGEFKSGLEKIYWYTNDAKTGIRHALMETGKEITFDDAKFMLVLCSAFVNYITAKAK